MAGSSLPSGGLSASRRFPRGFLLGVLILRPSAMKTTVLILDGLRRALEGVLLFLDDTTWSLEVSADSSSL